MDSFIIYGVEYSDYRQVTLREMDTDIAFISMFTSK
jgi:hypothetical protein